MAHNSGSSIVPILLVGGVGYYLYSSGFFSSLFGATSTPTVPGNQPPANQPPPPVVTPVTPPVAAAIQCGVNQVISADGKSCVAATVGATKIINGATYQFNGSSWGLINTGQVVCNTGFTNVNGTCTPNPPPPIPISQQMGNLAGGNNLLTMDQWCFYFTQITGLPCPRDPGDIIAAAGPNPPSFPQGRDTPIDVGTWLAFMNQGTNAGISGLGCDCQPKDKLLGGLGQILDFGDFFSLQPHRKHLVGNFK